MTTLAVAGQEVFGALALSDSTAFISRGKSVESWNFADPSHPVLVGSVDTPLLALDLLVSGDLLLAACQEEGVVLFDISNPVAPVPLSTFPVNGSAGQMAISGNLLAIADGADGVVLADITIPAAPVAAGIWNAKTGYVGGVAFSSPTTLWARQSVNGLTSLDLTNLSAIKELGKLTIDGDMGRLYAYQDDIICLTGPFWVAGCEPDGSSQTHLDRHRRKRSSLCSLFGNKDALLRRQYGAARVRSHDPLQSRLGVFFRRPNFCLPGGLFARWHPAPVLPGRRPVEPGTDPPARAPSFFFPCDGSVLSRFYNAAFMWQGVEGEPLRGPGFQGADLP